MIALKVEKRDGKVSIVLNAEAEEALREVEVVYLDFSPANDLIVRPERTFDERRERGRDFLRRYRSTFEHLAK